MLFTLEEIGVDLAMILATVGAVACFVWLLTVTWMERRGLRRLGAERRGAMRTLVLRTRSPRSVFDRTRVAPPSGRSH